MKKTTLIILLAVLSITLLAACQPQSGRTVKASTPCSFEKSDQQTEHGGASDNDFIAWQQLRNPVYWREGWSTKDACMTYKDGTFYIFFSAFFWDRGRERSHVTAVKTKDFINFSEPLFIWDGRDEGWIGMCSPNLTRAGDRYILTYNSWGHDHPNGSGNQLFYAESTDLENWQKNKPIAKNLTKGKSLIDIAMAYENCKYYIVWQDWIVDGDKIKVNRAAVGDSLDGDFEYIGDGMLKLLMEDGKWNGMKHENWDFLKIEGTWHLLSTDYSPHEPYLYRISGDPSKDKSWKTWVGGRRLETPLENFNTKHRANAAQLANWTNYDGHYYLLYAGTTHSRTHAGRGDNKLALARSTDLENWHAPGGGAFINWNKLENPVYSHPGWSTKDACMIYHRGSFYIFFSAFFHDRGRERSHVSAVKTRDFINFSEPLFIWDGRDDGWVGMCSPSVTKVGETFYLTYNSWGDKHENGMPNQLFYAKSADLENWEKNKPLAREATRGRNGPVRAIDAAIAAENGKIYLVWKERQTPQMAVGRTIDGPWQRLGRPVDDWFENGQFIKIDGKWHLLARGEDRTTWLAQMYGDGSSDRHWVKWGGRRYFEVPEEKGFNTEDRLNAAFIADWRVYDGNFYILYAGNTEDDSHAGRGDNKLGLARFDLKINCVPPVKTNLLSDE